DLGYLSLPQLVERLEKTMTTLGIMARHHGHFLNWYDTRSLQPLQPAYVSTVDSGNLMGCLIALKHGMREKTEEIFPGSSWKDGLTDTLRLIDEKVRDISAPTSNPITAPANGRRSATSGAPASMKESLPALHAAVQELDRQLAENPRDLCAWAEWLDRLG